MSRPLEFLALIARWIVAATLLYAFISKIFDSTAGEGGFERFSRLIATHGLIPAAYASSIAASVLVVELMLAIVMLLPLPPKWIGWFGAGLFTAFSIYLVIVFRNQQGVDRACFGRVTTASLPWILARNATLAALSAGWTLTPTGIRIEHRGMSAVPRAVTS
jgi:Methylamine utilisation protein MauE